MQDLLTAFDREGDADLIAQRARADIALAIGATVTALWRRMVKWAGSSPVQGQPTPAR